MTRDEKLKSITEKFKEGGVMRTKTQINKKVKEIQKERKTLPPYSMFGTPNWKMMDAQVDLLKWCLKKKEIEIEFASKTLLEQYNNDFPPDDTVDNAKVNTYDWVLGKTEDL